MSQTLYLPLDDAAGSTAGRNTVDSTRPLSVQGGSFVAASGGQEGYLDLPPGAAGMVAGSSPVDLSGPFTLSAQLKTQAVAGTTSYILLRFSGTGRYLHMSLPLIGGQWQALTIRQSVSQSGAGSLTVQVDQTLVDGGTYPNGWGMPTGFAVYNDDTRYVAGGVSWRKVGILNTATDVRPQLIGPVSFDVVSDSTMTRPQLIGPVSFSVITITPDTPTQPGQQPETGMAGLVRYRLNGILFDTWGIGVSASKNLFDQLERKESLLVEWSDRHGEWIDLSAPRYKPRLITLDCFIRATSVEALLSAWQAFGAQLTLKATQRLQVTVFGFKPLVYEVYRQSGVELEKQWRQGGVQYGKFTLVLKEPDPIKRVVSFSGPGTSSITLTSPDAVSIHWGDGTHDYDVYGTAQTISHAYQGAGTYYAIVSGNIDAITNFSSSGTVLWSKL